MPHDVAEWLPGLLERQCDVLSREQAIAAGFSRHAIDAHLRSERWQRIFPGVYAPFSGAIPPTARLWAAVLRSGQGAVLSHRTAAELWKLIPAIPGDLAPLVHVTVPRHAAPTRTPGIVAHHSSRLAVARHPVRLPPCTRVEETILDLVNNSSTAEDAASWVIKACQRYVTTPDRLSRAMRARSRLRWRRDLEEALGEASAGVHSLLERLYLRNVERPHGLPAGRRQVRIARGSRHEYQDVSYDAFGVCVELDGAAAHPAESRWLDVRRDNANHADGKTTLRYGWSPVRFHPCEVASEVGRTLTHHTWPGPLIPCGPTCKIAVAPRFGPAVAGPNLGANSIMSRIRSTDAEISGFAR